MRPTVLLFDIDGTLITTGGLARRAIERAFELRYGRSDVLRFSFGGMTDRRIVRDGLAKLGSTLTGAALEAEIDRALDVYLEQLAEQTRSANSVRVHPGVEAVLDRVLASGSCAVGLGTGNVRRGAELKLTPVGLYQRFQFGGFGCDHIERAELLGIGARRGAERLGVSRAECRVVVIGDTPKDVAAARAIGAECLAVATGGSSLAELRAAAPDYLFSDLAGAGVLRALLP